MQRLVVLSALVALVYAFPSGAPEGVCVTGGTPKHAESQPQAQSTSPFSIHVNPVNLKSGGSTTVTIHGQGVFRGFYVRAHDVQTSQALGGRFTPVDANQAKALNCEGGQGNAITHTNNADKSQVQFKWTAPAGYKGQVYFSATIVQSFDTFWKGVPSNAFSVQ